MATWSLNSETLQYQSEAQQVPVLRSSLADLQRQKDELGEEFDLVHDFVSEESIELLHQSFLLKQQDVLMSVYCQSDACWGTVYLYSA